MFFETSCCQIQNELVFFHAAVKYLNLNIRFVFYVLLLITQSPYLFKNENDRFRSVNQLILTIDNKFIFTLNNMHNINFISLNKTHLSVNPRCNQQTIYVSYKLHSQM